MEAVDVKGALQVGAVSGTIGAAGSVAATLLPLLAYAATLVAFMPCATSCLYFCPPMAFLPMVTGAVLVSGCLGAGTAASGVVAAGTRGAVHWYRHESWAAAWESGVGVAASLALGMAVFGATAVLSNAVLVAVTVLCWLLLPNDPFLHTPWRSDGTINWLSFAYPVALAVVALMLFVVATALAALGVAATSVGVWRVIPSSVQRMDAHEEAP